MDDVTCNGTEERLWDCPNIGIGVHNCDHSEDAGVRCQLSDPSKKCVVGVNTCGTKIIWETL